MKHFILTIALLATANMAFAQNDSTTVASTAPTGAAVRTEAPSRMETPALRFGYLSCDSVLHALPGYSLAQENLRELKGKYDAEMKRVEDEFNTKYEFFLQDQRQLAPSILEKRQAELQELMEKNMAFKEKAKQLLAQAEEEAMKPLRDKMNAAIRQIGQGRGLAFIINTDSNAAPYLDPNMGEDITEAVLRVAK